MKYTSFFTFLLIGICSCSNQQHDLLITNVQVIDVETGDILTNRTVAINGDSINAIYTKTIKPGKQTEVVDGTGKYLIPGLWDMHAHYHWNAKDNDLLMIPNGVLGVRDPWGDPRQAKRLREEHRQGTHDGVDIFTSGSLIDGSPSIWASSEVGTPEEARNMVNCQIAQGVDFVKPYSKLDKDVYLALMDEARKRGVIAAGHVPRSVILEDAVEAGHRIDDHNYGLESLYFSRAEFDSITQNYGGKVPDQVRSHIKENKDHNVALQKLEILKDKDIWFCPTFVSLYGILQIFKDKMKADPRNNFVPIGIKYDWAESFYDDTSIPNSIQLKEDAENVKNREEGIKLLIQSRAKILAGTDYIIPYIYPGFSLQEEMQVFVRLGMTPLQALQTATINPAQAMKNNKVGEVKVGKRANLLLLNTNPLEDIEHAQDIHAVILRGKHLNREQLDNMLEKAKQLAKAKHIYEWFAPRFESDGVAATVEDFLANQEAIDSEYPIRWNMLISAGRLFLKEDKIEEAFAMVKLTQDLNPDFVYAFAFSADIYWSGGDKEMARAGYQKSLAIYPCYNIVESWLKELDEPQTLGFNKSRSKELKIMAASLPCLHDHH